MRALALALLLVPAAALGQNKPPFDPARFEVDAGRPLELKREKPRTVDGVVLVDLSYASPVAGRVTATLVLPGKTPRRAPAILFAHWGLGTRLEWVAEAKWLAGQGVVSLLVDEPEARPGFQTTVEKSADDLAQTVIEMRRGLDVLGSLPEVDAKRIGYVGHSYGANAGAILRAVDKRPRAFVFLGGPPRASEMIRANSSHWFVSLRQSLGAEKLAGLVASIAPYDAERWAAVGGAPLFLQFGKKDIYVPLAEADRYMVVAEGSVLTRFYEGDHELSDGARADRALWLATHLGFPPPPLPHPTRLAKGEEDAPFTGLQVVLHIPGMTEIVVNKDQVYRGEQTLDLYFPEAARFLQQVPIVVMVHGQTSIAGWNDVPAFSSHARLLASWGFLVVVPSLGIADEIGEAEVQKNLEAAIEWVRGRSNEIGANRDKIGLVVFSTGGPFGLRALTLPGVKCGVALYAKLAGPPPKAMPPLLLLRAGRDLPRTLAGQAQFQKDALAAKLPLTVIELPDAHHSFDTLDDWETSRDALRAELDFLARHLK